MTQSYRKLLLICLTATLVVTLGIWLSVDYRNFLSDEQSRASVHAQITKLHAVQDAHRELELAYATAIQEGAGKAFAHYRDARQHWEDVLQMALQALDGTPQLRHSLSTLAEEARLRMVRETRTLEVMQAGGLPAESPSLDGTDAYTGMEATLQTQHEQLDDRLSSQIRRFFYVAIGLTLVLLGLLGTALYAMNFARLRVRTLEHKLKEEATHNEQTGLANRRYLNDWLKAQISTASRMGDSFNVMLLNLDGLSQISQTYGEPIATEFLKATAKRLVTNSRAGDFTAHIGNNEFVVIFSCEPDSREVGRFAERLIRHLKKPIVPDLPGGLVTVSIGMANYPADGTTPDSLLDSAAVAMQQAKRAGNAAYAYKLESRQEGLPGVWEVSRF